MSTSPKPGPDDVEVAALVMVPKLLSVASVARVLDCSPRTVRRRISEGSLLAVTDHGRVMVLGDDLRDYIDRLERIGRSPAKRPRSSTTRRFDWLRTT
jgi:hypothetical protein